MRSDAKDQTDGDHEYGFTGDPDNSPTSNRYFGYLERVGVGDASSATGPKIVAFSPADNATRVAHGEVSVTFGTAMDKASAEGAFSLVKKSDGTPVSGTFSWSGDEMTFTPTSGLESSTDYSANVTTDAQDVDGNALSTEKTWSFTTTTDTTAPTVSSVSPGSNATNVPIATNVSVTFSEPMNHAQTEAAFSLKRAGDGSPVSGTFSWSGNTMTFDPGSDLGNTKYTATISSAARDANGNALGTAKVWSFTTDTTRRTIKSTSPGSGATGVQTFTTVSVTFSEPMDHAQTDGAFSLVRTSDGSPVSDSLSWSGNTMTFDPGSDLTKSTGYTATVTTAARDLNGNTLGSQKVWQFKTWSRTSVLPASADVLEGTLAGGDEAALESDDDAYLRVSPTTASTRAAAWQASFTGVPKTLTALTATYKGKNSTSCTQTFSIWNWATNAWVQLSSNTVGTTEVRLDKSASGTLANYVGGNSGDEVRLRVRCTSSSASFTSMMGDLMRVSY